MQTNHPYAPYYCEENIWRLVSSGDVGPTITHVAFITNPTRSIALFGQRLASPGNAVVWDYHVIAFSLGLGAANVAWDFDSRAPFPCAFDAYISHTFRPVSPHFAPRIRLLPAAEYAEKFGSDRSHMLTSEGEYIQPPPPWAAPRGRGGYRLGELLSEQSQRLPPFLAWQDAVAAALAI